MERLGIAIAGLGLVLALAGSLWTIRIMYRKSWRSAALPIGLMVIFPVAIALGWDWSKNVQAGLGFLLMSSVLAATFTPMMMSRVGWYHGMERRPYLLNAVGITIALLGAIIASLGSP